MLKDDALLLGKKKVPAKGRNETTECLTRKNEKFLRAGLFLPTASSRSGAKFDVVR